MKKNVSLNKIVLLSSRGILLTGTNFILKSNNYSKFIEINKHILLDQQNFWFSQPKNFVELIK